MRQGIHSGTKALSIPLVLMLGLLSQTAFAQFAKTIQVTPGVPVIATTTWYFLSCSNSGGLGSYTINVAPVHGTVTFADVSGPVPGCPAGSPSLPAVQSYYTWTDTTDNATSDSFELYYYLNGQVALVLDVTATLGCPANSAAPQSIPAQRMALSGGAGLVTTGGSAAGIAASSARLSAAAACPAPPVITSPLPDGTAGVAYGPAVLVSGGTPPYSISAPGLPPGLSVDNEGNVSGTPAESDTGTYQVVVSVTDSAGQTAGPQTVPINISGSCIANASLDASKMSILPNPDNEFHIQLGNQAGRVAVFPGASLFGAVFPPFGMNIHAASDAVSYTGPAPDNVSYNFIQVLNQWSGNSVYADDRGESFPEFFAVSEDAGGMHTPPFLDSSIYFPPFPYYPYALEPIATPGTFLGDSPSAGAYFFDPSGRRLREMHYTKEFTAYFGCHTPTDEKLPFSEPKHFLRTLAIVKWRVSFSGKVSFVCFGSSFCPYLSFAPFSDNGVVVESEQFYGGTDLSEPPTVTLPIANQETRYQWSPP
jgi:Putative Ig domain